MLCNISPSYYLWHKLFFFLFFHNFRAPKPQTPRRHNHAEFFHHLERFPQHTAGGFEPDGDERVGRRLHVLHLRVPARVCVRQLRRPETAPAQRRLPAGRKSGHPGRFLPPSLPSPKPRRTEICGPILGKSSPVESDLSEHPPFETKKNPVNIVILKWFVDF